MKLVKGKKAATPKGMRHNVKTMEKKARRDESKGMKRHMDEKSDKKLVKKMVKKSALKKGKK